MVGGFSRGGFTSEDMGLSTAASRASPIRERPPRGKPPFLYFAIDPFYLILISIFLNLLIISSVFLSL